MGQFYRLVAGSQEGKPHVVPVARREFRPRYPPRRVPHRSYAYSFVGQAFTSQPQHPNGHGTSPGVVMHEIPTPVASASNLLSASSPGSPARGSHHSFRHTDTCDTTYSYFLLCSRIMKGSSSSCISSKPSRVAAMDASAS